MLYCRTHTFMRRYLFTALLCLPAVFANGQDTTAKTNTAFNNGPQIEIGAGAGFVFPGAVQSTLPVAKAFRAGMFLFQGNAHFNKRNHHLYFTAGLQLGLMPFSSWGSIPSGKPGKPIAEYRSEYLVTTIALVPGLQFQTPIGRSTKFCMGAGAGGMLVLHSHQATGPQKNILLEASVGLLADDMTAVGLRFYRPYKGMDEKTLDYENSYMLTGVLLDFRQRLKRTSSKH